MRDYHFAMAAGAPMAEAASEKEKEAKGFTETVLKTLGLPELFLGALALYGLWLVGGGGAKPFRSTGHEFADNALLVCAAALMGKIVTNIASIPLAIVSWLAARKHRLDVQHRLERAGVWNDGLDPIEQAWMLFEH